MVDEGPLDDVPPFEHVDEDEDEDDVHIYQTMFEHHRDGEETVIDPRSIENEG